MRAAAEVLLRMPANHGHLAYPLDDVSFLESWRSPVVKPAPRELVAVPLEVWAAEPAPVPLSTWAVGIAQQHVRDPLEAPRLDPRAVDHHEPPGCPAMNADCATWSRQ